MTELTVDGSVTESAYDMGAWDEVIGKGAFTKTLGESPDIFLNLLHGTAGSGMPIGRRGENMDVKEVPLTDGRGATALRAVADLDDDDPDVQLLIRKLQNGLIDGASFCFSVVRQQWLNDYTLRRITEVSLHNGDLTICPVGANPAARVVSMRAAGALAPLRAPGRDAARQRERIAEQVSKTGAVEVRSLTLDGVRYDMDAEPATRRAERTSARPARQPRSSSPRLDEEIRALMRESNTNIARAQLDLARSKGAALGCRDRAPAASSDWLGAGAS